MLLGERTTAPKSNDEIRDHNTGVSLRRELHAFLKTQSRGSKRFLRALIRDPRVVGLLNEIVAVVQQRSLQHPTGEREAFERMTLMHSLEFAEAEAQKLRDHIVAPGVRASRCSDRGERIEPLGKTPSERLRLLVGVILRRPRRFDNPRHIAA